MILNRSGRLLTNVDRYPQTDAPLAAQLGGCARLLGRMRAETGTDLGYRADEDLFDPIGTYIVSIPSLQLAMSVRTAENRSNTLAKSGRRINPFTTLQFISSYIHVVGLPGTAGEAQQY